LRQELTAARLGMLEEKDMTAASPLALRDEDGAVREAYVEHVAQAIAAGDSARIDSIEGLTLHVRAL